MRSQEQLSSSDDTTVEPNTRPPVPEFKIPIEEADIQSISKPGNWLTDGCIRELITHSISKIEATAPQTFDGSMVFVDPSWLSEWEIHLNQNDPHCTDDPPFSQEVLKPRTRELIIPYNLNMNHWILLRVNVRENIVHIIDSLQDQNGFPRRIHELMYYFFMIFQRFFAGRDTIRIGYDPMAAQQRDSSSCGVYAVRNATSLFSGLEVNSKPFTPKQIRNFRAEGADILTKKRESDLNDQSGSSSTDTQASPIVLETLPSTPAQKPEPSIPDISSPSELSLSEDSVESTALPRQDRSPSIDDAQAILECQLMSVQPLDRPT